jgi:hypothetical protein
MKTTMKLFGIIAMVAIVGFSTLGCVLDLGGNNDDGGGGNGETPNTSLNGYWDYGYSDRVGWIVKIDGSSGVYTQINTNVLSGVTLSAVSQGHLKVGDEQFRNLRKTGDLSWSGEYKTIQYYTSSPNISIGTNWRSCTITMDADGKAFHGVGTYTRRQ